TSRSGKLPAPPQMDFDTLMKAIDQLKIDHNILDNTTSRIIWKGQPLQISHLPKYDILHPKEAELTGFENNNFGITRRDNGVKGIMVIWNK
ncbi:16290_t:CDS:2, partial [Entrophospora sp. SA101]